MFQSMLTTGLTTPIYYNTNEIACWHNGPCATVCPKNPNKEITKTIRKKPKRSRTAYTDQQLLTLERYYANSKYIDAESRKQLAARLSVKDRCVKIWFQNRRMKEKKKSSSTESVSNAASPPVNTQQNLDPNNEKVESSNCMCSIQLNNSTEPVPMFIAYNVAPATLLSPSTSFRYHKNVFPTEYHPHYNAENYTHPQQNNWSNNAD